MNKQEMITKAEDDIAKILSKLEDDLNSAVLHLGIDEISVAQVGSVTSRNLRRVSITMSDRSEWSIKTID